VLQPFSFSPRTIPRYDLGGHASLLGSEPPFLEPRSSFSFFFHPAGFPRRQRGLLFPPALAPPVTFAVWRRHKVLLLPVLSFFNPASSFSALEVLCSYLPRKDELPISSLLSKNENSISWASSLFYPPLSPNLFFVESRESLPPPTPPPEGLFFLRDSLNLPFFSARPDLNTLPLPAILPSTFFFSQSNLKLSNLLGNLFRSSLSGSFPSFPPLLSQADRSSGLVFENPFCLASPSPLGRKAAPLFFAAPVSRCLRSRQGSI